jgi:transcriptional regulator with XRE-family HTH domain
MDVAQLLGVTETTVTNSEKNRAQPMLHSLPKIIEFLGYDPMPTNFKALHETLLQYRKSRGMTQKELAKQIGIDPATLSRLERNRSRCFQEVLRRVSDFLVNHA